MQALPPGSTARPYNAYEVVDLYRSRTRCGGRDLRFGPLTVMRPRWPGCCGPGCAAIGCHARHAAGLAPAPDPAQADVPGQARPPHQRGDRPATKSASEVHRGRTPDLTLGDEHRSPRCFPVGFSRRIHSERHGSGRPPGPARRGVAPAWDKSQSPDGLTAALPSGRQRQ